LRIGYFVGCGVDIIGQDAGHATLRLLKKIGKIVHMLENCCCGLPAWSYGDLKAARKLAAKNLSILVSEKFDVIVTDCSSCASFLKNYPQLFPEAGRQHEKAAAVGNGCAFPGSGRYRDLSSSLSRGSGTGTFNRARRNS
jgi:glycolate oxidase iron-sulfur subunit